MVNIESFENKEKTIVKVKLEVKIIDAMLPVGVAAKDDGKDETLKKLECED